MNKKFHLTKEGKKELEDELTQLTSRRKEIAERLQIARDYGDLSENAEYHSARDEQSSLEVRIAEIENILKNSEIIKRKKSSNVGLGSTVVLKNGGPDKVFTVVGSVEANPLEGKISDESPIGQLLLGKSVGDSVEVENHNGKTLYTIKEIK